MLPAIKLTRFVRVKLVSKTCCSAMGKKKQVYYCTINVIENAKNVLSDCRKEKKSREATE